MGNKRHKMDLNIRKQTTWIYSPQREQMGNKREKKRINIIPLYSPLFPIYSPLGNKYKVLIIIYLQYLFPFLEVYKALLGIGSHALSMTKHGK